ncbi:hypothetical protein PR048_016633 [Dryococelus australis]|uniref:DDE-1 domain-containing protein n=1 Tax=Dryococelus australis TaxID=614101 RepID=A0ABQ9H7C8_9NEOP|nr:hypothetical protein PR048_016633 [Dryococelus australis]
MTGSEKRRLLVVGKCADPQLLASVGNWPLKYVSNNKAWMTSEIFESELRNWDVELQLKNRRILLLVSDCSAHARVTNLKNIRVVYLPYHVASVRQPMGRGIFRSFKTQYRRLLMLQMMDCFEQNASTSVTLVDALRMLYKAWFRVPVGMIKNCFLQTGLMKSGTEGNVFEEFEDDIPLSLWLDNHNFTQFDSWKETIDWYVEADSELQTSEEPEEKSEQPAADESDSSLDDSVEVGKVSEESFVSEAVSVSKALCALRQVSKFFEQDSASSKLLKAVNMETSLEKMILNTQLVKEST